MCSNVFQARHSRLPGNDIDLNMRLTIHSVQQAVNDVGRDEQVGILHGHTYKVVPLQQGIGVEVPAIQFLNKGHEQLQTYQRQG